MKKIETLYNELFTLINETLSHPDIDNDLAAEYLVDAHAALAVLICEAGPLRPVTVKIVGTFDFHPNTATRIYRISGPINAPFIEAGQGETDAPTSDVF